MVLRVGFGCKFARRIFSFNFFGCLPRFSGKSFALAKRSFPEEYTLADRIFAQNYKLPGENDPLSLYTLPALEIHPFNLNLAAAFPSLMEGRGMQGLPLGGLGPLPPHSGLHGALPLGGLSHSSLPLPPNSLPPLNTLPSCMDVSAPIPKRYFIFYYNLLLYIFSSLSQIFNPSFIYLNKGLDICILIPGCPDELAYYNKVKHKKSDVGAF